MKKSTALEQFFLEDNNLVEKLIETLKISEKDVLLEVGAGDGALTKTLLSKAKKVVAVEIDPQFKKPLSQLEGNCQIIINDIFLVLNNQKNTPPFNKITGNLASTVVEPLIKLLFKVDFEKAVFFLPLKFVGKMIDKEPYSLYFKTDLIEKVSKTSFSPSPHTNWALVSIVPLPKAILDDDSKRYLKQYVFEHPLAKPQNARREGLIKYFRQRGKRMTKNEARKLLAA